MSNNGTESALQARGRPRNRSTSPLSQVHSASSDTSTNESGSDALSSAASPLRNQTSRLHRRNSSRIEDVSELSLDLKSLDLKDPQEDQQALPPTPNPPTPPPKPHDPLQPPPLRIKKKPLQGKPYLCIDTMQSSPARSVRLLIASLGNPKPYHSTRHSAGHFLLQALASRLNFPPLLKSKTGLYRSGADIGLPQYTLWQSTSLMNISGVNLLKTWKIFAAEHDSHDAVTGLVVLHDELELVPGKLKVRRGPTSAAGHNGIKSIQDSFNGAGVMKQMGDTRFVKIGIGIGRPLSRERNEVSGYVLGQLTGREKEGIEEKAGELLGILEREVEGLATGPL